jgi:hypothetical protein
MRRLFRSFACLFVAFGVSSMARAQNTVFNDSFTGDALNPAAYPAPTATATGWTVASNKAAPAPVESGGTLTINMAGTTSGFVETQALFAPAAVKLLPGTYIELTGTFIPTNVLTTSSDNLVVGLFNSGGSAPATGLLSSGLSNALTTFSTGGAKGWLGFNANIPLTGASPKMLNRAAQTAANNTVQDVLFASQSSSVGYTSPAAANFSISGNPATVFVNGSTYTVDYKLSLSADGNTLTALCRVFNGTGNTGTGANTLVSSASGTITGSNLLTKAFDAFAIGWRADAGGSNPSNIMLTGLTVTTTGGAPWFLMQPPPNTTVSLASDLNLIASVGGLVDSYQWQKSTDGGVTFSNIDAAANPSAGTASLLIGNIGFPDAGIYQLVATNAAGSTVSSPADVAVTASAVAPSITTNPVSKTVLGGDPCTFSVIVNGTAPLSFQWAKSTDGVTYTPIAGAQNSSYTIPAVSLDDEGSYAVTVTNTAGTATSLPAVLTVNQPLAITVQPVGAAVTAGASYTLTATAVGRPAPTYQWYLNGTIISGATNSSYAIAAATGADSGIYTVVANNTSGDSVTSSGAAIAVVSPALVTTALTPASLSSGTAPDTRLTLTFNQPVSVGLSGQIRIYDAANPTVPVDTIDMVSAMALMKTLRAGSAVSTQPLPVQAKTIGGLTNFHYYPITLSGNTATIYPRNNVLAYGKSYFVTIDPGVFTDSTGLSYAGISSATDWTFSTKGVGPSSDATRLVVAADGSGDFLTVQAALDFIPSGNTTPRTIFIRKGTYFEQIYFTGKHAITFLGEDRSQSLIVYPNNNTFNNATGSYHRMVFQGDHVNNVAVVNLTVQNSTPHLGSQAEALLLNGTATSQAIVTNVDLVSFQDTLQINGQAYIADSHISGDVDFMWGNGPNFFNNCELTAVTSSGYYTQIRNGSTVHGDVFLNCVVDAAPGVSGSFLGRIDPAVSGGFPFSEVVWLNCTMGTVNGSTYSTHISPAGWLLNNTADQTAASAPNVHFWEYNSHYSDGTPLPVSSRIGASRQLTMTDDATTIANYSTPSYVLGGWTPQLAPLIATQPVAQTVDAGAGFTLSVQAFGLPAVTYQWLRNGVPISGATSASYVVASSGSGDAGTYSVAVSNGVTTVTSSTVPLNVHGAAPIVVLQPASTSALLGTTATLNAWAVGDGPFTYQWNKNGAPITGATNLALRLTGLQASDAGDYTVAITNAGGTTVTNAATLTIATPAAPVPTLPVIPTAIFDVTAYGAVGDGVTDNTAAIQAAIAAANTAGGGTVEFPPAASAYLSGPITLSSNTNFQIDAGAVLQALPFGTYPRSFSAPAHFITIASGASNVEFSGGGIIDGDGAAWWAAFDAGTISGRPRLVQITKASNALFSGVTFRNSPNFHLAFSGANNNVTIFGVTISAPGDSPNTDGMDVAGTNFLIQGCSVSVGDDNIVAKPGSVFCQNLFIANCAFGTGHGLSIGGQTNVGLDGMTVVHCTFNGTDTGLRMKADPTQGGPVQNVSFTDITMTNVTYPILFYSYYNQIGSPGGKSGSSQTTPAKVLTWNATPPNPLGTTTIPSWQNITINNLTATGASGYSMIWGLPLANGLIANVTLNNVTISGGAGFELYDATNVQFTGNTSVGPFVTCNALGITGQPEGKTVNVGDTVTFSATAVGASGVGNTPPTYRWNHAGIPLTDGVQPDGATISGAATAALTITNVRAAEVGDYTVTVSNSLDGYNVASSSLVAGSLPVTATSAVATLSVNSTPATITLSGLNFVYDGTAKVPTVTTDPAGLAVQLTYNGSADAPINAGSYTVSATLADPNYSGSATDTLVIAQATPALAWPAPASIAYGTALGAAQLDATANVAGNFVYTPAAGTVLNSGVAQTLSAQFTPADATNFTSATVTTAITVTQAVAGITLGGLNQTYTGSPLAATATTTPAGLAVSFTYNGEVNAPSNTGSYAVIATIADANYSGTATGTLTISTAASTISLSGLIQAYDGTPKSVIVTTTPADLAVTVTYNGSETAPTYPSDYAVVASVSDSNYHSTASATLTIPTTVLVRHAPAILGTVEGSVRMTQGENLSLLGSATLAGDLLVPGLPSVRVSGRALLGGTLDGPGAATPTRYTITLSGNSVVQHVVRRIDPVALPVVATPPAGPGTRSATLLLPGQSPGNFHTLRNLTLLGNVGLVTVPPGSYGSFTAIGNCGFVLGVAGATEPAVYNLQSLLINPLIGTARLKIVGPVILTVNNTVSIFGPAGSADHPEWLLLRVANGGVVITGTDPFHGSIVAPNGTVIVNPYSTLDGSVIANDLTILPDAVLSDPLLN